jgi:predicted GNAT family N-acyltransferase
MGIKQIDYGTVQYAQMVELRSQVLRKPIGLDFTEEELDKEKDEILIGAFDEDEMIGCCMLTKTEEGELKLRQMAVKDDLQGTGIGASIISFAENIARDRGFGKMVMNARDSAVGFYEKLGYKVVGDAFTEVNLPHHKMEKRLL